MVWYSINLIDFFSDKNAKKFLVAKILFKVNNFTWLNEKKNQMTWNKLTIN